MLAIPWFWIWIGLAAILFIGEMLTTAFFMLPFAIGAAVAAIASIFGAELWLQWLLFIVVSVVILVFLRPIFKRITSKAAKEKSGVDRFIGMTGHIIDETSPSGEPRVKVGTEIWNAIIEPEKNLEVDTLIRVLGVDGTKLIVEEVIEETENKES